jgi:hypothetical protein
MEPKSNTSEQLFSKEKICLTNSNTRSEVHSAPPQEADRQQTKSMKTKPRFKHLVLVRLIAGLAFYILASAQAEDKKTSATPAGTGAALSLQTKESQAAMTPAAELTGSAMISMAHSRSELQRTSARLDRHFTSARIRARLSSSQRSASRPVGRLEIISKAYSAAT